MSDLKMLGHCHWVQSTGRCMQSYANATIVGHDAIAASGTTGLGHLGRLLSHSPQLMLIQLGVDHIDSETVKYTPMLQLHARNPYLLFTHRDLLNLTVSWRIPEGGNEKTF